MAGTYTSKNWITLHVASNFNSQTVSRLLGHQLISLMPDLSRPNRVALPGSLYYQSARRQPLPSKSASIVIRIACTTNIRISFCQHVRACKITICTSMVTGSGESDQIGTDWLLEHNSRKREEFVVVRLRRRCLLKRWLGAAANRRFSVDRLVPSKGLC